MGIFPCRYKTEAKGEWKYCMGISATNNPSSIDLMLNKNCSVNNDPVWEFEPTGIVNLTPHNDGISIYFPGTRI